MSMESKSRDRRISVRHSQVLGLFPTIAIGASLMVSLGIFIMLGLVLDVSHSVSPYLLFALVYLPVALTYAERAMERSNGRGGIRMGRSSDPNWYTFSFDWLVFGGLASLVALLGWGLALYLNLLLGRLFQIVVAETYLALAAIVLMAMSNAFGQFGSWQTRTRLVYLAILVLGVVIGWGWFSEFTAVSPMFALPQPGNIIKGVALLGSTLWGLLLIIDHRDQIRRPERFLLPSLVGVTFIVSLLGFLASQLLMKYPELIGDLAPLASLSASSEGVLEVIYLVSGIGLVIVGMDRVLVSGRRILGSMFREGYFPSRYSSQSPISRTILRPLFLLVPVSILVIVLLEFQEITSLTALFFFLSTVLVNSRSIFRVITRTQGQPRFRLPFHPLFPALSVVIALYFAFALAYPIWLIGLFWAGLGGIYYFLYARKGGMALRRREQVVSEELPAELDRDYQVLVNVADLDSLNSLLGAGVKLAQMRLGGVVVLQVLALPEDTPAHVQQEVAHSALKRLTSAVEGFDPGSVPVETMVRLSPSRESGVLETAREEKADLILLGWDRVTIAGERTLDESLNHIVKAAPCDVAILRGEWFDPITNISIATAGGPHATEALKLGQRLAELEGGRVEALYVIPGTLTAEKEAQAHYRMDQALAGIDDSQMIQTRIVVAKDIKNGILRETTGANLLLLGASHQGFTDQDVFDGIPVEVAGSRPGSTLLVKHFEGVGQFTLQRLWDRIYDPFPKLTVSERLTVNRSMSEFALGSVDFYALILLASVVAILGLMQNSTAVIIGAMLVAPLMSPILAVSHGIVSGDIQSVTRAGESTIKGIVLAISVAIAVSILIPAQPITREILSRTQPNLLDLLVALASGAAAAYSLSRKHLAAALPGVAIAVSLVPPLVVIGYGLGYGIYSIAGGAALLFLTNLSAIILAAAVVFMLLGFRPMQAERGRTFRRGLLISMVAIIVIATPLGFETFRFHRQNDRQRIVEAVLSDSIESEFAAIEDVSILPVGDGFLVSGTVYAYEDLTDEEIKEIQLKLSQAVGAHVSIRARVIQARLETVE